MIHAMNATSATTLSVNPVASTLGARQSEISAAMRRGKRAIARRSRHLGRLLSDVMAVRLSRRTSAMLLMTRLICGAVFVMLGICSLGYVRLDGIPVTPLWMDWIQIGGGSALAIGLLCRPAMLALTAGYAVIGVTALNNGTIPLTETMSALTALVCCVAGPGRYSCDMLIYNLLARRRQPRKNPQARYGDHITHEAFSTLNHAS